MVIGKAHQNHQRAWHSEMRPGKLVAEKGVSTAGDPDCLRVFLFLVRRWPERATPALLIRAGMGAVVMNYSLAVTIGNKYAIRERSDDVEMFH